MAKRQRQLSILVIPDDGSRTQEFKVGYWLLRTVVAAEALLILLVFAGGISYWRSLYWEGEARKLRRDNQRMRAEVEQVQELAQVVTQMKEVDLQLRTMLDVNTDLSPAAYSVPAATRAVMGTESSEQMNTVRGASGMRYDTPVDPRALPSVWPIARSSGVVTREFSVVEGVLDTGHSGIDIATPVGTNVVSTADGTVAYAGDDEVLGQLVAVDHFGAYLTRYGHNDQLLVRVGDRVRKGQTIALSGNSGQSSGPHLHYEVWENGRPQDPRHFITP